MKAIFFTVFSLLFLLTAKNSFAQTKDSYLLAKDAYLKARQEYLTTRQTYLNYQTLQTKEILAEKLKTFIVLRDDFLASYLTRLKVDSQLLLAKEQTLEIETWFNWLLQDREKILQTNSLDDLLVAAKALEKNYPQLEKNVYYFLARLAVAKQGEVLRGIEEIKIEISCRAEKTDFSNNINSWLDEINWKTKSVENDQLLALKAIEEITPINKGDALRGWNKARTIISETNRKLSEALFYLDEIIKKFNS